MNWKRGAVLLLCGTWACNDGGKDTATDPVDTDVAPETPVESDTPEDSDVPEESDTPEETDTPEDTDVEDDRAPGPLEGEVGLITAWLQLGATTLDTTMSAECTETGGDWAAVFAPPPFNAGSNYYVFFRVESGMEQATGQMCPTVADYPDNCTDRATIYDIDGHVLTTSIGDTTELIPGCELSYTTTTTITDDGNTGSQSVSVEVGYVGMCGLPEARVNDACIVTHSFDLEFAAAR